MTLASETFAIEGARCAGCFLKIERSICELPGVQSARANATHHRLRLEWDSDRQSAEALSREIASMGYEARPIADRVDKGSDESLYLPQLAAAGLGMMNIMMMSVSVWFGLITDMGSGTVQMFHWISAAIALPVVAYSGAVFHRPALRALAAGRMTMDTPITLGIWITMAASFWETLRGAEEVYYDAAVSLIFFLLIGRVLEQMMKSRSGNTAENIRALIDDKATIIEANGNAKIVNSDALQRGDAVLVKTGARIPADGELLTLSAVLDESPITGESMPVTKKQGSWVLAGSIVIKGPITLEVSNVGDASQIGEMSQLIDNAVAHKGKLQVLSDRFARGYIPTVFLGGAFGFVLWYWGFGASAIEATMIAVAVLIVTCPCAAGLSTPAVTARAINHAMRAGVVIKSGSALERLGNVTHVFMDKTGTASHPMRVNEDRIDPSILENARSLAAASQHPLARALVENCTHIKPLKDVTEHRGAGISALNGAKLGSADFVGAEASSTNRPCLYFSSSSGEITVIEFSESACADLGLLISSLDSLAMPLVLVSGDTHAAVSRFAKDNGLDHFISASTPAEKLSHIRAIQREGKKVLMIGDGINDSPALAGADVSISFGGATQIAQITADIIMTSPMLKTIPKIIEMARNARRLITQNLVFSTVYNLLAVPLAVAGFLSPAMAALLMSTSSIVVLVNGFRLKAIK